MKTAKQLQDQLEALTVKLNALGQDGADEKAKAGQLKTLTAEIEAVTAEIKTLTQADADERAEAQTAIKAANARIEQLEADARRRSVAEKVSVIKVPAFRAGMEAMYAYALSHAAEKVRVYAKGADGKETSVEQTLVDIADGFAAQINAQAEKLFKTFSTTGGVIREEGSDDPDERPDVAMDREVRKYMASNPTVKDYLEAWSKVRELQPELARRYSEQTAAQ